MDILPLSPGVNCIGWPWPFLDQKQRVGLPPLPTTRWLSHSLVDISICLSTNSESVHQALTLTLCKVTWSRTGGRPSAARERSAGTWSEMASGHTLPCSPNFRELVPGPLSGCVSKLKEVALRNAPGTRWVILWNGAHAHQGPAPCPPSGPLWDLFLDRYDICFLLWQISTVHQPSHHQSLSEAGMSLPADSGKSFGRRKQE